MRKPHKVDVSLDSDIDLGYLSGKIAEDVVSAYLVIKGFKTLCSIVEHLVVTRVK